LRYLTWQIQQIAEGDYEQSVSFSGDFSDAINKMIVALRERHELSLQIKENEYLFHSIFNTSPDGIILCDLNNIVIQASLTAYRLLNISDEQREKLRLDEMIHPEDASNFKLSLSSLLNRDSVTAFSELRIVPQSGDAGFWCELNASLLLDSDGSPKGFVIIIRDISERKMAEAQLLQYTDDLDKSNKTKDKLFSIISHDLKSPFSALLGTCKLLSKEIEKENINIERVKKFSRIIGESAVRAYDLLNNLLEWSRLQSNKIEINPEKLNLHDVISENVNIGHSFAMSKNINLIFAHQGNCPIVSDRALIDTVLRNLISNAVKYTPYNGSIIISLQQSDNIYMISVKDNGIGIPADKLEMLFKTDNIHSTPGTGGEKGTGLGLGLCRDFIQKLGGDIHVESVQGKGTTFSFTLVSL
jgi:PAS domain S-box-containing protein